jgi:hypothetical protein
LTITILLSSAWLPCNAPKTGPVTSGIILKLMATPAPTGVVAVTITTIIITHNLRHRHRRRIHRRHCRRHHHRRRPDEGKSFSAPSYAALLCVQDAGSSRNTVNGWISWKTAEGKTLADLRDTLLKTPTPAEKT